jgi:Methyltransferase domain
MNTQIRYRRDLWKLFAEGYLPNAAAEIGVAEGNFSRDILSWPVQFNRLYMVDRWRHVPIKGDSAQSQEWHDGNLAAARLRVQEFGARAVFLQGESQLMAHHVKDGELSLLYIDADHSYEGVKHDLWWWRPKVHMGGVIAFHDYENSAYGVKRAVREFAEKNKLVVHLLPEDKPEDAGAFIIV